MALTTYTGPKPNLSFWQIWNMCFGFFGIQFGWSLQMNNMSAIYEYLGASPDKIPGLWLAAPLTGLLVQPIIGYLSDRTWHPKLGRRKPYFLIGAILSSLMLFVMPNSPVVWMAAGSLWILGSCINVSMEPFRAYVADNLNEKQQAKGYSMQSMFIGAASFIAGFLPSILHWLGVKRESTTGAIPDTIKYSFYIGGAMFLGAVLYTILKSKEYPPSVSTTNNGEQQNTKQSFSNGVSEIISAIKNMPLQMRKIALVNFLTWPGLFLMWFFYSNGVAVEIFGGDAQTNKEAFTKGIEYAGQTDAILNLITFLFSILIPYAVIKLGKKNLHSICLLIGGIGLISIRFVHEPFLLFVCKGMVGIAWASILSMPYAMLAGILPKEKMGLYMGVFNFFIVLPEIIASLTFGYIMSHWLGNERLLAVLIGGVLLCTASLVCYLIVKEERSNIPEPAA
ncbi:MAG: MFS transporter [Chitinophagaceae bacterium]|nr:MFS transporter [Chitinophagaceae bacterium]